jgi:hypothetical protein
MAEKMTTINLPGRPRGVGFMDYGDVPADKLIATYRRMALRDKEEAEAVLAASDADFRIVYVEGKLINRPIRVIQEGRR